MGNNQSADSQSDRRVLHQQAAVAEAANESVAAARAALQYEVEYDPAVYVEQNLDSVSVDSVDVERGCMIPMPTVFSLRLGNGTQQAGKLHKNDHRSDKVKHKKSKKKKSKRREFVRIGAEDCPPSASGDSNDSMQQHGVWISGLQNLRRPSYDSSAAPHQLSARSASTCATTSSSGSRGHASRGKLLRSAVMGTTTGSPALQLAAAVAVASASPLYPILSQHSLLTDVRCELDEEFSSSSWKPEEALQFAAAHGGERIILNQAAAAAEELELHYEGHHQLLPLATDGKFEKFGLKSFEAVHVDAKQKPAPVYQHVWRAGNETVIGRDFSMQFGNLYRSNTTKNVQEYIINPFGPDHVLLHTTPQRDGSARRTTMDDQDVLIRTQSKMRIRNQNSQQLKRSSSGYDDNFASWDELYQRNTSGFIDCMSLTKSVRKMIRPSHSVTEEDGSDISSKPSPSPPLRKSIAVVKGNAMKKLPTTTAAEGAETSMSTFSKDLQDLGVKPVIYTAPQCVDSIDQDDDHVRTPRRQTQRLGVEPLDIAASGSSTLSAGMQLADLVEKVSPSHMSNPLSSRRSSVVSNASSSAESPRRSFDLRSKTVGNQQQIDASLSIHHDSTGEHVAQLLLQAAHAHQQNPLKGSRRSTVHSSGDSHSNSEGCVLAADTVTCSAPTVASECQGMDFNSSSHIDEDVQADRQASLVAVSAAEVLHKEDVVEKRNSACLATCGASSNPLRRHRRGSAQT